MFHPLREWFPSYFFGLQNNSQNCERLGSRIDNFPCPVVMLLDYKFLVPRESGIGTILIRQQKHTRYKPGRSSALSPIDECFIHSWLTGFKPANEESMMRRGFCHVLSFLTRQDSFPWQICWVLLSCKVGRTRNFLQLQRGVSSAQGRVQDQQEHPNQCCGWRQNHQVELKCGRWCVFARVWVYVCHKCVGLLTPYNAKFLPALTVLNHRMIRKIVVVTGSLTRWHHHSDGLPYFAFAEIAFALWTGESP